MASVVVKRDVVIRERGWRAGGMMEGGWRGAGWDGPLSWRHHLEAMDSGQWQDRPREHSSKNIPIQLRCLRCGPISNSRCAGYLV